MLAALLMFFRFGRPLRGGNDKHQTAEGEGRAPTGFHAEAPGNGEGRKGPNDDQGLRSPLVHAKPCHASVGQKKSCHTAQHPKGRDATGSSRRHEGESGKDETEIPQVEQIGISKPRTQF